MRDGGVLGFWLSKERGHEKGEVGDAREQGGVSGGGIGATLMHELLSGILDAPDA